MKNSVCSRPTTPHKYRHSWVSQNGASTPTPPSPCMVDSLACTAHLEGTPSPLTYSPVSCTRHSLSMATMWWGLPGYLHTHTAQEVKCHRNIKQTVTGGEGGSLPGLHTHMVAHVVHAAIVLSLSDVYPLLRVTTIILHIKQPIQLLFQQCLWVS